MLRPRPAHTLLFPLAAGYAMLAVPISVGSMQAASPLLPGLATATGHAHEMLFGFVLAVLAGFLIARISGPALYLMAAVWLAARAAYAIDPGGVAASLLTATFAVWVAGEAAPPFLRAAKKLRNRVFGPVLLLLALTVVLFHLAGAWEAWQWRRSLLHEAMVLVATVAFFMGGRTIAPAAAGHLQHLGEHLAARVQPRLEGAVLALLGVALASLPFQAGRWPGAAALALAGSLTAVRLWRWRLWRCRGRPDLKSLGVGYAWLAAGLIAIGLALVLEHWRLGDALHTLTTGALGTLTITVMARTRLQRAQLDPATAGGIPLAAAFISVAAVARVTAPLWGINTSHLYWLAALCWSLAYLLLLRLLLRVPGR